MDREEIHRHVEEVLDARHHRDGDLFSHAHRRAVEEDQRRIVKEALKEWLDEKWAAFGKWSIRGILAAGLAAIVTLILMVKSGWPLH